MGLEPGGYAEKLGNRYEGRWVVRQLLYLLLEKIQSVMIEPCGDDEFGVDLWIEDGSGRREAQQCKSENGPNSKWTIADLNERGILEHSRRQLLRAGSHMFTFVSSIPAVELYELTRSARDSSGDAEHFYRFQVVGISKSRQNAFHSYCKYLSLDADRIDDRYAAFELLQRTYYHHFVDDDHSRDELRIIAQLTVHGDPETVLAVLAEYAVQNLRKRLTCLDLTKYLQQRGMLVRRQIADERVTPALDDLRVEFIDSIEPKLANGKLIPRIESDRLFSLVDSASPPTAAIVHGPPGFGKSGVLYQFAKRLYEHGYPFLAVRLDRRFPRRNAVHFGQDLGLPDSPVKCLRSISGDRPTVLILDQLDALRWTNSHSAEGLEVCKAMVREIHTLRKLGHRITVVISCRSFDLQHDRQICEWLKRNRSQQFEQIEISALSEELVKQIVESSGVQSGRLSNRRLLLLSCIQNLTMWTEIMNSEQRSPEFDSATGLMRAFWKNRRQHLEQANFSPDEREKVLNRLVDYMEQNASLSAPSYLIERHEKLSTELQTLGILTISDSQKSVSFTHQSYLDFLIASRVLEDLDRSSTSVLDWLGDRSRQSLFRREQLRQVLFLLADERPAEFVRAVHDLISSPDVRFHIKQLTLEALSQIHPDETILDFTLSLLSTDQWREHILQHVFRGNRDYINGLADRGILREWLNSGNPRQQEVVLGLLQSVADYCGDLVAELCSPLLNFGGDWPSRILDIMIRSDEATEPEQLFRLRIRCCRAGAVPCYVPWTKIEKSQPDRVVRMLSILLEMLPENSRGWDIRKTLGISDPSEYRAICRAARRCPFRTWRLLSRQLLRIIHRRNEIKPRTKWDPSAPIVPRVLATAFNAAARRIARRNPERFFALVAELPPARSKTLQRILVDSHAELPALHADVALRWLISDPGRLRCGSTRKNRPWIPASRLITRLSPHCSSAVFTSIESYLLRYRDPQERNAAAFWLAETRHGRFRNLFGAAQFHLLPALCPRRRSVETNSRIGVLERKFGDGKKHFCDLLRARGGVVHSPINLETVDRISDKAWLQIMTSEKILRDEDPGCRIRYLSGSVVETSIECFAQALHIAALRDPERFAQLALKIPINTAPDYVAAIMDALGRKEPPSEIPEEHRKDWYPATSESVQECLERWNFGNDTEQAKRLCWILIGRNDLVCSPVILNRIAELVAHPDPKEGELHVSVNTPASNCSVDKLEVNAINCVRGLVARVFAHLLFEDREMLSRLRPGIRDLLNDKHPSVRVATVAICLATWNIDRDLAMDWFMNCVGSDLRVAACSDARRLYNHAFPRYADRLVPLIRRMIASEHDDVAEAGGAQVAGRWVFHGLFEEELAQCHSGSIAQRKGIAQVAAKFAGHSEYGGRSRPLAKKFFNDPERIVRQQISLLFQRKEVLRQPDANEFLSAYLNSETFRDDPTQLLRLFERSTEPLIQFSDLVFDLCQRFANDFAEDSRNPAKRTAFAGHLLTPVLLRLYEQTDSRSNAARRQQCLDAWDTLLEHRIGTAWTLTRELDR